MESIVSYSACAVEFAVVEADVHVLLCVGPLSNDSLLCCIHCIGEGGVLAMAKLRVLFNFLYIISV